MPLVEPSPEERQEAEEAISAQYEERRQAGWRYQSPDEALAAWVGLYRATWGFTRTAAELRCGRCGRLLVEVEADDGRNANQVRAQTGHSPQARGRRWPRVLVPMSQDGQSMDAHFQVVPPTRRATESVAPWRGSPLEFDRDKVSCHPKKCGRSYLLRSETLIAAMSKVMLNGRRYLVVGAGRFATEEGGQDL